MGRPFAWAGLVGLVFAFLFFLFAFTPPLGKVKQEMSFLVSLRDGKTKKILVRRNSPEFVRLAYCPSYVRGAIIVSEDANFYRHRGVDFVEIWQAILEHFSYGERLRGASTITQQVAKNAYLSRERSFLRKMKEYFLARRLERVLSKEEILDYYVNGVEFGEGIYGLKAAARHYFQKDPSALGPAEAATLAFFLPNPVKRGRDFIEGRDSAFRDKSVSWAVYQIAAQGYMPRGLSPVPTTGSTNEAPASNPETNEVPPAPASTNTP
ncbi:MAG: transglycosylase domain-containing protein [Spirochaetia bacterium]|nr:transglycosylase domain-containing protein [Spirochaetia bacterium]